MAQTAPVLASSYEVAEDGLSYTFHLNQGVLFHNGTELTSEDVTYTYEYYSREGETIASRFINMSSVEALDRYTVRVNMSAVNAAFLRNAGEVPIVPAAYHAEVGDAGFRTAPIGTGAFSLAEWRPAEFTELVAFPDHFRGPPGVERLRLEVVPEPCTPKRRRHAATHRRNPYREPLCSRAARRRSASQPGPLPTDSAPRAARSGR
jgi:peptide/nickel transport system substrate-binding protein